MKRIIFIIPLFFLLLSCEMKGRDSALSVLTWNMYLLFDDVETGEEFPPFQSRIGYTPEKYWERIENIADILSTPEYESDIMFFQEIESEKVLKDLLDSGLGRNGYEYFSLLEINSPITVGYISKYRPIETRIHGPMRERPILELVFRINGEKLHVFLLHARSQIRGGEEERMELFTLLDQLMKDRSTHLCIALGDFNEDPVVGYGFRTIDDRKGAALVATGDMGQASYGVYYSPSLDEGYDCAGSYYYDSFLSFDHILFTEHAFDGRGHDFSYAELLEPPGGVDEHGRPIRYSMETGLGVSDHFALRAELKYNR